MEITFEEHAITGCAKTMYVTVIVLDAFFPSYVHYIVIYLF